MLQQVATDGVIGFRARKAAQVSACFILWARGPVSKMKLIKLLYLAERRSAELRGRPMFYDMHYSLKDGPICSFALDGINGRIDRSIWNQFIRHQSGNSYLVASGVSEEDFDELSESDSEILRALWEQFGWMSASQLRKWTHKNCPEYVEVDQGRLPISYSDIGKAIGFEHPEELAARVREYRSAEAAIAGIHKRARPGGRNSDSVSGHRPGS